MNLLNIEHISKIYGEKIIFDDASFGVQEGDKIGIVGINGTGKTTLLRMIAGTEVPDDGQIIRQNGMKIAHLTQNPVFPEGATILSYVQSVAEDMEWRVQSNLNTLGITDHTMKIEHLSGGQKRRVAMAKVLAEDFDLLLLDEPTNHLDGEMISWLEGYLRAYRGTVIMVTHDRYFLDQVTNRILEISHGKMYSYDANYTTFLELKAQREEMELASERKRQSILRMELEWAKRGCRARTTKQKARLERLESLKNGSAPVTDDTITLDSVETRMGKKTMPFINHFRNGFSFFGQIDIAGIGHGNVVFFPEIFHGDADAGFFIIQFFGNVNGANHGKSLTENQYGLQIIFSRFIVFFSQYYHLNSSEYFSEITQLSIP